MKTNGMIYLLGILAAGAAHAHGPTCVTKSVCARIVAQCRSHQLAEPRRWRFVAVAALQEEAELSCRTERGEAYTERAVLDEIPVESAVWPNEADALSECGETLALELGSRKRCEYRVEHMLVSAVEALAGMSLDPNLAACRGRFAESVQPASFTEVAAHIRAFGEGERSCPHSFYRRLSGIYRSEPTAQ